MTIALAVAGYLLGSIPVAWILAKIVSGQDLRDLGSGNLGVMNVMLSVSRAAGGLAFLAEALKGVLAVWLARAAGAADLGVGITVLATIAGTRWSVWMRGAGGRGNTAAMSALLVISWATLAAVGLLWGAARLDTGRSFIASRVTLVLWPAVFGIIERSWGAVGFGYAVSLLFLTTHLRATDNHLAIKSRWASLGEFLTSPPRRLWSRRTVRRLESADRADPRDRPRG